VLAVESTAAGLSVLMIAATPVIGAHYMIDVFGGVALAVASIWAAKLYLERLGRSPGSAAAAQASPSWQPGLGVEPQ
jgi:membrane-associated phospholipid phosphatase